MAFTTPPEVLLRHAIRCSSILHKSLRLTSPQISSILCSSRTYKAAVCTKLGQPLEIQELSLPSQLKSDEVLISTHASGINYADILTCKGMYQERLQPPFVPGFEMSGKIMELGKNVTGFRKGDRVFVMGLGKMGGGAAEHIVTNTKAMIPVPDSLSLTSAAATIVSYGTAMMALTLKANLKKNETVLVTAAAGATGLAATDIALNLFGCKVIAVCGGDEKCKFMKEKGATHTIDYKTEKIRERVKEITRGKGVNVVVDQVGGDQLLDCVKSLSFEGRALTVGYASGTIPSIPANLLLLKSASLIGVFWGNYAQSHPKAFFESITQVLKAVSEGKLHPHCGTTFPLEQINDAYQHILDKKNIGKVVLKMKEENYL